MCDTAVATEHAHIELYDAGSNVLLYIEDNEYSDGATLIVPQQGEAEPLKIELPKPLLMGLGNQLRKRYSQQGHQALSSHESEDSILQVRAGQAPTN